VKPTSHQVELIVTAIFRALEDGPVVSDRERAERAAETASYHASRAEKAYRDTLLAHRYSLGPKRPSKASKK
jgi:hypothetical protein